MKQIKVTSREEGYYDYSWLTTQSADNPFSIDQEVEELRNQIKEIKRELKMHIQNCPFRSITGKQK